MKSFCLIACFALCLLTGSLLSGQAFADQQTISSDPSIGTNALTYDFGTRLQGVNEPIQHDFVFVNQSVSKIVIDRVQTTCSCTTAVMEGSTPGVPLTLMPGKSVNIHVTVDPRFLSPGPVEKLIWIYAPAASSLMGTLRMVGKFVETAKFEPSFLNFGKVKAGTPISMVVTETLDTQLYSKSLDPISGSPQITVTRIGSSTRSKTAPAQITQNYQITLTEHAPIGPFESMIALPSLSGQPEEHASLGIAVGGEVIGDLTASSTYVAFGSVTLGHADHQSIVITGKSASVFDGLRIESDNDAVTCKVINRTPMSITLEVGIVPKKVGVFSSTVHLRTKNGQELQLKVSSFVN